jgi:hypothetical protein
MELIAVNMTIIVINNTEFTIGGDGLITLAVAGAAVMSRTHDGIRDTLELPGGQ